MHIWVDADACPRSIKEILYRAANRRQIPLTLVASLSLSSPNSIFINTIQVQPGPDSADHHIYQQVKSKDLVITADIPLAASIVEKGAFALNPRGEFYTGDNVKEHLSRRNLMQELRMSGVVTDGPPTLTQKDRKSFADQLDRFLTKYIKGDRVSL